MNSTKAQQIIKAYVTPIPEFARGLPSSQISQHYKTNIKVQDITVYNNIRLKTRMVGLITNAEEAQDFLKIKDSVNKYTIDGYNMILNKQQTKETQ